MTFRILFKNGTEFSVIADSLDISRSNFDGSLASVSFKGIKHNKPCYLNLNEVIAIVRVLDDEEEYTND